MEDNHILMQHAMRENISKITCSKRSLTVINSLRLQIFLIDSEQVLDYFQNTHNFVFVIN
jgi:hypothetical protein